MRTQTRDLPGRLMSGQIPFSLLTQYPYGVYNSPESEVNRMDDTCSCHNESPCACCKTKLRSEQELRDLINRLSRIEGQIRGIRSMVEKDAYCIDILTQVSAASAALSRKRSNRKAEKPSARQKTSLERKYRPQQAIIVRR